jgi:hypothetical protein
MSTDSGFEHRVQSAMIAATGVADDELFLKMVQGKDNCTAVAATILTSGHQTAVSIATIMSELSFVSFLQQNLAANGITQKFRVSKPEIAKRATKQKLTKKKVFAPEIQSAASKKVVLGGVAVFLVLGACLSCVASTSASAAVVAPTGPRDNQPYQSHEGSDFY